MSSLFLLFRELPILGKLVSVAVFVLSLGAAYAVWHHWVWTNGYTAAIHAIAAQDDKAIGAAKSAREKWKACTGAGKKWDQSTGECRG
jgi:hypothetical protein